MKNFLGSRAMPDLIYHRPRELAALLDLVENMTGEFKIVAGCTDFIPSVRRGAWRFADGLNVIDIKGVEALRFIREEEGTIVIGAATRLADVITSALIQEKAPVLADAVHHMASPQVRNTATIGGNLCMASPAADTAPPLLVLDAEVTIQRAGGKTETVPLNKFFLGPGTTRIHPREVLTEIRFPAMQPGEATHRLRIGLRTAFVCSIISVATWVKVREGVFEDVRIAMGAVAPTPIRLSAAEGSLKGKNANAETIAECALSASEEIKPITDLRASAEYRQDLANTLTRRALTACLADLGGRKAPSF